MSVVVAVAAAAGAAALLPSVGPTQPSSAGGPAARSAVAPVWWVHRYRVGLAVAVGSGAWVFVGGRAGLAAGAVATIVAWRAIGRMEPEAVRRRREAIAADLPAVVHLIGVALRAGVAPISAVQIATAALPGAASSQLGGALAPHRLGMAAGQVWEQVALMPGLEPLGRALSRSSESGASVVAVIERLSTELGRERRAVVEDRARRVGVQAAVPLGLCLLPAFLLVGIVPLVGGLIGSLAL